MVDYTPLERFESQRTLAYFVETNGGEWTSIRAAIPEVAKSLKLDVSGLRRTQAAVVLHRALIAKKVIPPLNYVLPWHRTDARQRTTHVRSTAKRFAAFYESWEWKRVRYDAIQRFGRVCMCCGTSASDGAKIVVDHIKPVSKYWELRLEPSNVQVLCHDCNRGKGARDQTDWRDQRASNRVKTG